MGRRLHTALAIISSLAVFAPDLANLAGILAGFDRPWLAVPVRVLGAIGLLLSNWQRIRGKLQPLLDAIDQGKVVPITGTPTPVTRPETPSAKASS